MGLAKLCILVEKNGSAYQFDDEGASSTIKAMFNPNKLTFGRTVKWGDQQAAKRDNPELQFTGSDPVTITIDLLFDTYDDPDLAKDSVKDKHIDKLMRLTTVESHGDLHRPPLCRLVWGTMGMFFQGVLTQLEVSYTMFIESGRPVRATARCSFKQWIGNLSDLQKQNLMSSDVAKTRLVKRGDSLATIAAAEYGDPRVWRVIAEANGIDDPLALLPGTRLVLPARHVGWSGAMR